jgi:hypothetical protein
VFTAQTQRTPKRLIVLIKEFPCGLCVSAVSLTRYGQTPSIAGAPSL